MVEFNLTTLTGLNIERTMRIVEITEENLMVWELQLRREGTLPPSVQTALLEWIQQTFNEEE